MKHLVSILLTIMALGVPQRLAAEDEAAPVPILKAPYHLPVFRNDYVTLLNVYVPPGRTTGFHTHTGDSVSVNVEDAEMSNREWGSTAPPQIQHSQRGRVSYADYRKKPYTHAATNVGSTPFHNISLIFNSPQPYGFTPGSRNGNPAYTLIMDNQRVRAWRLILEPGQTAASIAQQAPGIRIVLSGGEFVESVPGQPDRAMSPKMGEFFWQDTGTARSVRNIGTSRVEWVEFELK